MDLYRQRGCNAVLSFWFGSVRDQSHEWVWFCDEPWLSGAEVSFTAWLGRSKLTATAALTGWNDHGRYVPDRPRPDIEAHGGFLAGHLEQMRQVDRKSTR